MENKRIVESKDQKTLVTCNLYLSIMYNVYVLTLEKFVGPIFTFPNMNVLFVTLVIG